MINLYLGGGWKHNQEANEIVTCSVKEPMLQKIRCWLENGTGVIYAYWYTCCANVVRTSIRGLKLVNGVL